MNDNVPAELIKTSRLEKPGEPGPVGPDPMVRDPILDQQMGTIGRHFGYGDEKKANIVGMAFILFALLLVLIILVYIFSEDPENKRFLQGLMTPVFGVITGAIGYFTGRKE